MRSQQANQSPWMICQSCDGEGQRDNLGVVSRDAFSDDEWDDYLDGCFDSACAECNGTGKVREPTDENPRIVRFTEDGVPVIYHDADDASEHFLRMAGG